MRQDQADAVLGAVMDALEAGRSLNSITMGRGGTLIIRLYKLRKLMTANPEWSAIAAPLIAKNALAAQARKGDLWRNLTHCIRGHDLSNAKIRTIRSGTPSQTTVRECVQCVAIRSKASGKLTPEIISKVTAALERGATVSTIIVGTPAGGGPRDPSLRLIHSAALAKYRAENPDYHEFVNLRTRSNRVRGRLFRHRLAQRQTEANDYHAIRAMVGEHFPGRDDVISNIFEALLNKTLKREDIPTHIKRLKADYNRMFPTNFARFGNSRLVSLDEVLFEGGSMTRGDTLSQGLWD